MERSDCEPKLAFKVGNLARYGKARGPGKLGRTDSCWGRQTWPGTQGRKSVEQNWDGSSLAAWVKSRCSCEGTKTNAG